MVLHVGVLNFFFSLVLRSLILPPDLSTEVIGLFTLHVLGDFLRFLRLVRQSMRGLMFSVELRLDLNFMFERVGH